MSAIEVFVSLSILEYRSLTPLHFNGGGVVVRRDSDHGSGHPFLVLAVIHYFKVIGCIYIESRLTEGREGVACTV